MDLIKFVTNIYLKYPMLRPSLLFVKRLILPSKPTYSGGGITTIWELPWTNNDSEMTKNFLQANEYVKKNFIFSGTLSHGVDKYNYDDTFWVDWLIAFAAKYVITFTKNNNLNFVECGVADGNTTFHALSQLKSKPQLLSETKMWLYDSWGGMQLKHLDSSEKQYDGRYSDLDINICKNNLKEFKEITIYNQGYVPEVFESISKHPDNVNYLHIDLNSVGPSMAALEFFYPKMQTRGVIIFDDYGGKNYNKMRNQIDKFLSDKKGILLEIPNGRAIFFM
tara:strand:+ start:622 stop:1458 length:837 start_codon:yes stop_codon:yes gene_type:complete